MLDTEQELEDRVGDVVVCDKDSIERLMKEVEQQRQNALWVAADDALKPQPQSDGKSVQVLIHWERSGSVGISLGHFSVTSNTWIVNGQDVSSEVVGWHEVPTPRYPGK